ncbi:MAG: Hsp20/alpha crystallin family protein [Armatimonadetes bacterium]|nr:Hsp20/alpha crystallin family protein [Armatimonadota bacterium]
MSLVRWDPFRDLESLQEDVNRLFQESMARPRREAPAARVWAPPVDVVEDDDKIVVKAELPGMKREDIDIELSGEQLTIRGERKFESEEKKDNYVRIERAYGQFQRTFTIGVPVKSDQVKAAYKDGILEVTIPKSEEIKPKKVDVTVE